MTLCAPQVCSGLRGFRLLLQEADGPAVQTGPARTKPDRHSLQTNSPLSQFEMQSRKSETNSQTNQHICFLKPLMNLPLCLRCCFMVSFCPRHAGRTDVRRRESRTSRFRISQWIPSGQESRALSHPTRRPRRRPLSWTWWTSTTLPRYESILG